MFYSDFIRVLNQREQVFILGRGGSESGFAEQKAQDACTPIFHAMSNVSLRGFV